MTTTDMGFEQTVCGGLVTSVPSLVCVRVFLKNPTRTTSKMSVIICISPIIWCFTNTKCTWFAYYGTTKDILFAFVIWEECYPLKWSASRVQRGTDQCVTVTALMNNAVWWLLPLNDWCTGADDAFPVSQSFDDSAC